MIGHQRDRKGLSPFWLHLMDKPLNLALERGHGSTILEGEGLTVAAGRRPGQKWSDLHPSPSRLMKAWAQGPLGLRPSPLSTLLRGDNLLLTSSSTSAINSSQKGAIC